MKHDAEQTRLRPPTTDRPRATAARIGVVAWFSLIQTVVVEQVVAAGWHGGYSRSAQFVSELGNPRCAGHSPCTDLSSLFDVSVGLAAVCLALGAGLLTWAGRMRVPFGLALIVASFGLLGIALFPLGEHPAAHGVSANLFFVFTPVVVLLSAATLFDRSTPGDRPTASAGIALVCGVGATAAWVVHASAIAGDAELNGLVQRIMLYFAIVGLMALGPALSRSSD